MPSMIDARCERCGRRYGWCGEMRDQPPCPKCGHRPEQAALDAAQAQMDETERLIFSEPSQELCGRQRVAAGLTLRQAAKLLGVEPRDLADVEHGRAPLMPDLAAKMAELYGVAKG